MYLVSDVEKNGNASIYHTGSTCYLFNTNSFCTALVNMGKNHEYFRRKAQYPCFVASGFSTWLTIAKVSQSLDISPVRCENIQQYFSHRKHSRLHAKNVRLRVANVASCKSWKHSLSSTTSFISRHRLWLLRATLNHSIIIRHNTALAGM